MCLSAAPAWFSRRLRPSNAEVGEAGERLAARLLRRSGLRVLGRRVSTSQGEIDLVALEAGQLVCVEVKTSLRAPQSVWRPGDRFDRKSFERQRRAAKALAKTGLGAAATLRLDLIEVWIGPAGSRPRLLHHRDLRRPISSAE